MSRDEDHDTFLADRDTWLAAITPTVFCPTPIAPFVINAVTADCLTFDLAVWKGAAPEWPTPPVRYQVGMLASSPFDDLGAALEYAVAEQLRGMTGALISLIQREEHLKHLTGVRTCSACSPRSSSPRPARCHPASGGTARTRRSSAPSSPRCHR